MYYTRVYVVYQQLACMSVSNFKCNDFYVERILHTPNGLRFSGHRELNCKWINLYNTQKKKRREKCRCPHFAATRTINNNNFVIQFSVVACCQAQIVILRIYHRHICLCIPITIIIMILRSYR